MKSKSEAKSPAPKKTKAAPKVKKTPTKKVAEAKKKADRPKVKDMVIDAVTTLHDPHKRSGTSVQKIKKFIADHYDVSFF